MRGDGHVHTIHDGNRDVHRHDVRNLHDGGLHTDPGTLPARNENAHHVYEDRDEGCSRYAYVHVHGDGVHGTSDYAYVHVVPLRLPLPLHRRPTQRL